MADFFKIGQAAYGGGADTSKAIGEGLQKSQQVFMAYLGEQKAKREKADNITKQYLAQIPNVNSITKIPEWMRTDVNNYLVSEKEKYTEVAKQLSTMSSRDPGYMDAVNELQNIKNNFAYLNDQLNQFQEDSKQYALDVDNGKISEGFKEGRTDEYNKTAAIYTGNAKLNIQNGSLFFNVDGKNLNYSRGEVGNYFKKDFAPQTALLTLAKQVEIDARKGFTFESARKRYEGEIDAFLNKGGKEAILSMVYDTDSEFITGGGLKTPDIQAALLTENYDQAARLIKVELMKGVETEHASIYKAPEPKTRELSEEQEAGNRAADAFNTILEDPIAFAKTKLRGGFKSSKGDSQITLQVGEEEKTYDLTDQSQIEEFMDVARENSGLATGTSKSAELTRNAFYNLVKEKSLEISRFYKAKAKERKEGVKAIQEEIVQQTFVPSSLRILRINTDFAQ